MREWQSQSHVRWYCRYHLVFVPKYRKQVIFGQLRKDIGKILRGLCEQHGVELVEGHAMPDHVHLCLSIPPKYSVANTAGFLKGKSAIRIHREHLGRTRNYTTLGSTFGREATVSARSGLTSRPCGPTFGLKKQRSVGKSNSPWRAFRPFHTAEAPLRGLHQTTRYAGGS